MYFYNNMLIKMYFLKNTEKIRIIDMALGRDKVDGLFGFLQNLEINTKFHKENTRIHSSLERNVYSQLKKQEQHIMYSIEHLKELSELYIARSEALNIMVYLYYTIVLLTTE